MNMQSLRVIRKWCYSSLNGRCKNMSSTSTTASYLPKMLTQHVLNIYKAALEEVQPNRMIIANLKFLNNELEVGHRKHKTVISLNKKRLHVIAFGKAVSGMARAVVDILGENIASGVVLVPQGTSKAINERKHGDILLCTSAKLRVVEGAHLNSPDLDALRASEEVCKIAQSLGHDDVLLTLISGGGSALLTLPVPPVTIDDIKEMTRQMSIGGASIVELNTVRKQLELLKGGGLARIAYPAQVVSLILSDIIGDPVDCIASGPTVLDTSSRADALAAITKYIPVSEVPTAVSAVLHENIKERTLNELGACESVKNVFNFVVGSNTIAVNAAVVKATELGFVPFVISTELSGQATHVGREFAELASRICCVLRGQVMRQADLLSGIFIDLPKREVIALELEAAVQTSISENRPLSVIAGGETTVKVTGSGKGGRNQELCLSALISMQTLDYMDCQVCFASLSTDGQDGPTDAAGAVVYPDLVQKSHLDPIAFLSNNDSYSYFNTLGNGNGLVKTGLTGTNVMDIQILVVHKFSNESL